LTELRKKEKGRLFMKHRVITLSFKENPFAEEHEISSRWTRVLGAAHSKNFVILTCTVLIQYRVWQTDRQTDGRTPQRWLRRAMHSAVARKKWPHSRQQRDHFSTNDQFCVYLWSAFEIDTTQLSRWVASASYVRLGM